MAKERKKIEACMKKEKDGAYKVSASDIEDSGSGGGIVDSVKQLFT
jgi:hypothetical protein